MKPVFANRFDHGKAESKFNREAGTFSISKHFDILSYPYRLSPYRGMAADTASTGIGNLLVGSDGNFYGLGWRSSDHTKVRVWTRASGSWVALTQDTISGIDYNCFVEYHTSSGARRLFHSTSTNAIGIIDPADIAAPDTHALTYTNIGQGFVHPDDDCLYIPYDNKVAVNNNGTWTDAGFVLPANYRATSCSKYGKYLAIAACPSVNGVDFGGGGANSKVFLWDRDTSNPLADEVIDWGTGNLKVLNNVDGVLVGVMDIGGSSGNILDRDFISIKGYANSFVFEKVLSTEKQTTSTPDAVINPRVNFVNNGRFYFSINLDGGSTSPSYRGLWSLGKSKLSGHWAVTLDRVATIDNSETAVLAAAIAGDKCSMVYNSEGTLSFTETAGSTGDKWTATSVYESSVNPQMPEGDFDLQKQLEAAAVYHLPLTSTGQIVLKYRVDGGAWTTVFTKTASSPDSRATGFSSRTDASGLQFTAGSQYEFRIESTGGAEPTGFAYGYTVPNPTTL